MSKAREWVKDIQEITVDEFESADEIVRRFWSQQDKTVQATVTYKADISVTVRVPDDWSDEKVIEQLKDGYYEFDKEDEENVYFKDITEIILNGNYVKLKK